jgi:hypothetical protein
MIVAIQPRMRDMYTNAMQLLDVIGFGEAIAVDDKVDLNPVAGVMTVAMPSSLAAAIAPLEHLVPSIRDHFLGVMRTVRERTKEKIFGLHPELFASVMFYTHNGPEEKNGFKFYQRLNVALRSRIRDNAKPYFGYLRMLVEALRELPSHKGLVHRGVAGIDLTDRFPIGKPVRVWEVLSVSKQRRVAEGFASFGNKPHQTLFVIETGGVAVLGSLSLFPTEEECLFLPGTAFVATKAEYVGTRAVIYLTHRAEDVTVLYK